MTEFLLLHLILNPRRAISLAHSKSKLLNSSVKKEFFKSKYSVPSLSKKSDDLVWLGSGRSNGKKKHQLTQVHFVATHPPWSHARKPSLEPLKF